MRQCVQCGESTQNNKFCSIKCQGAHTSETRVNDWLAGKTSGTSTVGAAIFVRNYLIRLHSNKCQCCGWGEVNLKTGNVPLEIHHKDGNPYNNSPDNLEILCPNCHSLTDTYRNAGKRKSSRPQRKYKVSKQDAVLAR